MSEDFIRQREIDIGFLEGHSPTSTLSPATPSLLFNLATVRTDLGHWKAAAAAWRRALALTPRDADAYRSAAGQLTRGARLDDALPLYGHAAALDPTNWHNHYSRAHAALRIAHVASAAASARE